MAEEMTMLRVFNVRAMGAWRSVVILIVCVLAVSVVASGCRTANGSGPDKTQARESVYDRVIRAGTIRAAYITYPPALMKDTTTGKMTGIFVETLERAAENLGLKVQWTEEVGWGSQIEGLTAERYDIVGSPVWANPTRGKLTTLTRPVYYSGIGIYARANDNRFERAVTPKASGSANWAVINSPNIRISTIDGETGDLIARTQFPLAKRVSLPQTTDISQLFLEVSNNKADVFFAEPYFAAQYFKSNPRSVRNITEEQPIKVLGNCYMLKAQEFQFKQMLDVAIEDLINSGFIDGLLARYDGGETFYRAAYPYRGKM
jgi:ABC-type amino acid transport substrate-binding protein